MFRIYRDKLFECENKYLGVGITENGEGVKAIPVPWDSTAHAFNMKTPDIYISADDIFDNEIMDRLCKNKIVGCYIFEKLKDYSFISRFKDLRDIYIRKASGIKNLSFLSQIEECRMFFFEDLSLDSLDEAFTNFNSNSFINGVCLGLCNCNIKDVSVFQKKNIPIYELAVWNKREETDESVWQNTRVLKKNFYVIE